MPQKVLSELNIDEQLDCFPALLWRSDQNGLFTYFNRAWLEFRGRSLEEEKGLGWIEGVHPDDLKLALDLQAQASNNAASFERKFRLQGIDKSYRWIKDTGFPVYEDGLFTGYCGSAVDITNEYQELEQKETLLKEINHRIKNNLQILSSLLSISSQQMDKANAKTILQDCQNRIHAIVLLHEKLFKDQKDGLKFEEYIRELAPKVLDSYRQDSRKIRLQLEIENVSLNPDEIITCGLIINELLSNSAKHAYPNHDHGDVTIRFTATGSQCCLEVSDRGIGFTPQTGTKTLGLKLVATLAKQLGGELAVEKNAGTKAIIRFPR